MSLSHVLHQLCRLQGHSVDLVALKDSVATVETQYSSAHQRLTKVVERLQLGQIKWLTQVSPAETPLILFHEDMGWGVLRGQNSKGQWVVESWDRHENGWQDSTIADLEDYQLARLSIPRQALLTKGATARLVVAEMLAERWTLTSIVLATVVTNLVALGVSFYTMQVYDRVVPTGAVHTLIVLSIGIFLVILYELVSKKVRSRLYDRLVERVDQKLAHSIYQHFLAIRLDQLPASVGSLASQIRGYETVRGFLATCMTSLIVDLPFVLIFVLIIASIAGWLAVIPVLFLSLSVLVGFYYKAQILRLAEHSVAAVNFKTGLLVETVEGAETLKAGQGAWRMLSRWMGVTNEARDYELEIRRISEHAQHLITAFQQMAYVALVASGAWFASQGELTMGGIIACSILSGRILGPVAMLTSILVQWGHVKVSLQGLDALWALETDQHHIDHPLQPETLRGEYNLTDIRVEQGETVALAIEQLKIQAGEKVGVIGPVGSGKTTFLRLLSGMYKPVQGRVRLDGLDLLDIARPQLSEKIGYIQQEGRLFAGTLRENLLIGMLDPGDEAILNCARQTGLMESVVMPHPKGLNREINEGGGGLSRGQCQLVHLTRAFLRQPSVWLLDEPTASMDRMLEMKVAHALKRSLKAENTLVLVTHKLEMLDLVDRVVVVAGHRVVMDGPKAEVMRRLNHRLHEVEGRSRKQADKPSSSRVGDAP